MAMTSTIEQGRGWRNREYWTVRFEFPESAKHFAHRGKRDYMPKHNEIGEMMRHCLMVEPVEKRKKLKLMWLKAIKEGFNSPVEFNGAVKEPLHIDVDVKAMVDEKPKKKRPKKRRTKPIVSESSEDEDEELALSSDMTMKMSLMKF